MRFIYSAFIENSLEMREWLESIGIPQVEDTDIDIGNILLSYFNEDLGKQVYETADTIYDFVDTDRSSIISCLGNPELFKAVTALRDDSDIGKHYINNHTGQWKRCDYNMATDENIDWNDWSEAYLSELQERFKK